MFDKIFFYRIWQKPFFCISLSVCLYITNLYKLKIYYTPFIFLLIIEWNFRVRNLIRVTGKLRIKYLEFEYQNHIIWIVFFLLLLHVSGFGCTQIPCCNSHSLLQLLFSTIQCAVFALIAVPDPTEWELKFDIGLIGILYQVTGHFLICQFENERVERWNGTIW